MPREWTIFCAVLLLMFAGCARNHYHKKADQDSYGILDEKTTCRPWHLTGNFSVDPAPQSRLCDPSNPNDPKLPCPGPHLYSYRLPPLTNPPDTPAQELEITPQLNNAPSSPQMFADMEEGITIQPIPAKYWEALPRACLSRMLEFETVREEFQRTYGSEPPESLRDPSPKLTFRNIVDLAYLNSREYQTEKESLYQAALALSLERFNYMCKFSAFGNGVDVDYTHDRTAGVTENTLSTPSNARGDKMIALGGTVVTSFANNVLLTFNGPQGFAKDVNSTLLFEFTQSIFQRDVLLEPLIQSERNVVYAARRFARFRKQFFVDLATTYYRGQLGAYRSIEINTQNYFANVRALAQAEAEVAAGVTSAPPRVQIDQIEQQMLNGRSTLITSCNGLERSLDELKLTLGLPTETRINIDLRELESLTRRDEIEVAGELVRRARERVTTQLSRQPLNREEILTATIVLLERVLYWLELRQRSGQTGFDGRDLRIARGQLRIEEVHESLERAERDLGVMRTADPPTARIHVFRGTMNVVQTRLELVGRQLQMAEVQMERSDLTDAVREKYLELRERADAIREKISDVLQGDAAQDLRALLAEAEAVLAALEELDVHAKQMTRAPAVRPDPAARLQQTVTHTKQLLQRIDQLATEADAGLTPVELSADDAMVTALVQRFDLMNERGALADDWRAVKLAADDLKSVLNLNVSQSFRTRNNKPFKFTFNDATTQVGASLDLPLNRRQQRNGFRTALIDYQVGRRGLMRFEDDIKFEVRQGLRDLELERVQYDISIVSSALASERVYSTQLELALGLGSITARDFLEAQRAYRESVTNVAFGRLEYIVRRARLAFNLEVMMLDDAGFWPEINNNEYQPAFDPLYPCEAGPTYGDLPRRVWPSKKIKRLLNSPLPGGPCHGAAGGGSTSPTGIDGGIPEDAEVVPAPLPVPTPPPDPIGEVEEDVVEPEPVLVVPEPTS